MAPHLFPSQVLVLSTLSWRWSSDVKISSSDQSLHELVSFVRLPAAIKLIHLGSRHDDGFWMAQLTAFDSRSSLDRSQTASMNENCSNTGTDRSQADFILSSFLISVVSLAGYPRILAMPSWKAAVGKTTERK